MTTVEAFPGLNAVLALFEKILRELWIAAGVGSLCGGLVAGAVVVAALALCGRLQRCPPPPRPPYVGSPDARRPYPRRETRDAG